MRRGLRRGRRAGVVWLAVGAFLAGLLSSVPVAVAGVTVVGKPLPPSGALGLPATPVVSGSAGVDLGYLPGSGSVSASGQYSYTIPIQVPAGRGGAAPGLALVYSSSGGNGVLGVGWSLSGLSSISRCGLSLSAEGVTQGVHFTDYSTTADAQRDRFCLDGQKLVATSGGYGADGSVYRTEQDQNLNIVSHATSSAAGGEGPDSFTVLSPDGSSRTYTPMEVTRDSATGAGAVSVGKVRATWVLSSSQDASGNGVAYHYNTDPTSTKCPATELQVLVCSIDYTTFNGDASGALRQVLFIYDGKRPDNMEFSWVSGVESQLLYRLTTIEMYAPDPAATMPVWEYLIGYQGSASSFSGRSLLSTVQRCAIQGSDGKSTGSVGDCTWMKQFGYTQGSGTPSFVDSSVSAATNLEVAETMVSAGPNTSAPVPTGPDGLGGAPPMLKVADVNGDGVSDLLVQTGGTDTWRAKLAAFGGSPCIGDNYGQSQVAGCLPPANFGPLLVLGSRGTQASSSAAATSPLATSYDLSSGYGGDFFNKNNELNTDVSANGVHVQGGYPFYPNGWLENVLPVDTDGTGQTSLFVNDLGNGTCGRLLDWGPNNSFHLGVGFTDRGINYGSCTPVTRPLQLLNSVQYTAPGPSADFTGAGRGDIVSTFTPPGGSPVVQPLINLGNNQADALPTTSASGVSASCPYYVGDFTGDGRAQVLGQQWNASTATCGQSGVLSYNPFSGAALNSRFTMNWDTTGALPDLRQGEPVSSPNIVCDKLNPADCVDKGGADGSAGPPVTPLGLFFGDFNGDGLTDVVIANPVDRTLSLRFNTGNGFGAPIPLGSPGWMNGAYSIRVADLNHDGRADLVVFHEVNTASANLPQRAITLMLSKGDGSFTSVDLTPANTATVADPGLRTFDGWTGAVLGNFNGDGNVDIATLVGDAVHTVNGPDGQILENRATVHTLMQPSFQASLPGSTVLDQPAADLLATVSDEGSQVNRVQVSYGSPSAPSGAPGWSDKPESLVCSAVRYPQRCITGGLVTVRSVTSTDTTASSSLLTHTVFYSYEDPVADLRGRGFLGFNKVRVWDPTRLQQTITLFNNSSETGTLAPTPGNPALFGNNSFIPTVFTPGYYPGAHGQPLSVTTITAIPSPGSAQTLPSFPTQVTANGSTVVKPGAVSVNARVDQTIYNTTLVQTGGETYRMRPATGSGTPAVVHNQWEATASMDSSVTDPGDPSSDYMWGLGTYPLTPPATGVVTDTTTVPATCDTTGNNPGTGTGACIDSFGNVTASVQQSATGSGATMLKGATTQSVAAYNNLTTGLLWMIGQPVSVTVTDTEPGTAAVSRKTAFDYDSAGRLSHTYRCQQVIPAASGSGPCGSFALVSTTTMGYDQFGNTTSTATTALGPDGQMDTRQLNIEYDKVFMNEPDERIFPSQTWVPNNYPGTSKAPSTWQAIQPAFGVAVASEDVNGVQSQATFDDQGRPLTVSPAGSAETTYSYTGRTDTVQGITGLTESATTGGVTGTVQSDSAGNTILTQQPAFDGTVTDTATVFDTLGRAIKTSRPFADGTTPQYFGTQVLDGLDRVIQSTTPDGKTTKHSFTLAATNQNDALGLAHTVNQAYTTDPVGNQSVVDTSVDGDVIASGNLVPDPAPATTSTWQLTTFHYQPFGLPDVQASPAGITQFTGYDTLGRVISTTSPDSGTTNKTVFDGFDELLSETHQQSGAVTTYSYDPLLGRETGWNTTDNGTVTSSSYTFDNAPNGLGKLGTATSSDGVLTAYAYDTAGRQTAMTEVVNGTSYTITQGFDTQGRPSTLSYPAIGTNTSPGVTLTYGYNTNQYLNTITYQSADQTTPSSVTAPQPLWTITGRFLDGTLSAAGDPTPGQGVTLSNQQNPDSGSIKEITAVAGAGTTNNLDLNYTYNNDGQEQSRTDTVNGRTENYTYDTLGRLATWALSTCSPAPCTAPATATSTRTTSYSYDPDGNLTKVALSPALGAPATTTQNNTFTGITAGPHALDSQTTGGTTTNYTYDTHGRLTGGGGRNLTYNACNLPTTITNTTGTWTMKYGPDCQLASKTGPDGTTVYVGGIYQHRTTPTGTILDVFQIPGIGQIETDPAHNTTKTLYTVTDTQGSTGITVNAATGTAVGSPDFYEPFGTQINTNGTPNTGSTSDVTQGFTGQENNTNEFGLDNYGGRYYDPVLKRFTTPDPVVSDPLNTQSWNPYSYTLNNPVNNTDPTGYTTQTTDCGGGQPCAPGTEDDHNGQPTTDGSPLPTLGNDGQLWLPRGDGSGLWDALGPDTGKPQIAAAPPGHIFADWGVPPIDQPAPGPTPNDGPVTVSPLSNAYTDTAAQWLKAIGNHLDASNDPIDEIAGGLIHSVGAALNTITHSLDKTYYPNGYDEYTTKAVSGTDALETIGLLATIAGTALTPGSAAAETTATAAPAATEATGAAAEEVTAGASGSRLNVIYPWRGRPDGGKVFTGHGGFIVGTTPATTRVPEGTWVYLYSYFSHGITARVGLAIEFGAEVENVGAVPQAVEVFGPGDLVPNYSLAPPSGFPIASSSAWVDKLTPLSDILTPNMGNVHWSACTACVVR